LLEGDVAREFLREVVAMAQVQGLTSDEAFQDQHSSKSCARHVEPIPPKLSKT
jgi:hypothetical protein